MTDINACTVSDASCAVDRRTGAPVSRADRHAAYAALAAPRWVRPPERTGYSFVTLNASDAEIDSHPCVSRTRTRQ
jgi:hypothetical protein